MGEKDLVAKEYFEDPHRLADLLNAELFQGEERIGPEDIIQRNPSGFRRSTNDTTVRARVVTRDLLGELHTGLQVVLIALVAQSSVHYAMPLRVLNGDGIGYDTQWRKIRDGHEKKRDLRGAEFLSGFGRKDRLTPILTIVLYFGEENWDGPRSLKEMMDLDNCPREVAGRIGDYPLQLVEVRKYPHSEWFRSDLQYVFGFLQRDRDKEGLQKYVNENAEAFSHLDGSTYQMIRVMSHSRKILKRKENYRREEGDYDMCQALREMMEDSEAIGEARGISIGEARGISIGEVRGISIGEVRGIQLARQVISLQKEGKMDQEIAQLCGIEVEKVREILL